SNRRLGAGVTARVKGFLLDKYRDFGPTLAAEKLAELEGIAVSRETVRRLQIELGVWKPKRRRHKRVFDETHRGDPHTGGAQAGRAGGDRDGEVESQERLAALGLAADDADGLLRPQPGDEPAMLIGAL